MSVFLCKISLFSPHRTVILNKKKKVTIIQCPTCSHTSVGFLGCHSVDVRTRHILGLAQSLSGAVTCHAFLDVAPPGLLRDPRPICTIVNDPLA